MIILGLTSVLFDSFSHVREKNDLKNNRTDFQRILPELDALIRELVLFSQQFSDIFTFQERRVLNTMKNQLIPLKSLIGGWLQHGKNDLSMLRKYQSDIMNIRGGIIKHIQAFHGLLLIQNQTYITAQPDFSQQGIEESLLLDSIVYLRRYMEWRKSECIHQIQDNIGGAVYSTLTHHLPPKEKSK